MALQRVEVTQHAVEPHGFGKLGRGVVGGIGECLAGLRRVDRKSTRLNSSHTVKSYAVFCLEKKMTLVAASLLALAGIWLRPGDRIQTKLLRSLACSVTTVAALAAAALITFTRDMTEDRRISFPLADERLLPTLTAPL